jgi:hypothetical protein
MLVLWGAGWNALFAAEPIPYDKADAKSAGGEGTWKLLPPVETRGRIDFDFKSGIEFVGRSPSLYTFFGDDLLMVVYPEAEKGEALKNPDLRQPPTHFGSDGNRNMWILRRMPALTK